jgi:hypothetical protein
MVTVVLDKNRKDYNYMRTALRWLLLGKCAQDCFEPTSDYLECQIANVERYGFGFVNCSELEWMLALMKADSSLHEVNG